MNSDNSPKKKHRVNWIKINILKKTASL